MYWYSMLFFLHFSEQEGTSPVQYIAAHLSKIHGLDWNPNSKSELATCSQDCSVKVNKTFVPENVDLCTMILTGIYIQEGTKVIWII